MTAQMATRLTLRSFKHEKREVSIISPTDVPSHKKDLDAARLKLRDHNWVHFDHKL